MVHKVMTKRRTSVSSYDDVICYTILSDLRDKETIKGEENMMIPEQNQYV